jgi:hypothetical protein
MAWSYSDWETGYTAGSAAQLARLKLHIKEVSDALTEVDVTYPGGRSHVHPRLTDYLKMLRESEAKLEKTVQTVAGSRVGWARGRAIPE